MGSHSSLFHVGDNIELWRVLAHLCALVSAVFLFELLLHRLEHAVARSRKFEKMVSKVYRELMVLGIIGLALKIVKESTASANESSMLAFQIADLTIFILALALLLQATCVFLRLRKHDRNVERAELTTTGDLVEWSAQLMRDQEEHNQTPWWWKWRHGGASYSGTVHSHKDLEELMQLRLLRHLFLRRFNLPELFPFSKYLRQAQDNQLTHMIDVELSTWMVLLAIAWALDGVARGFEQSESVHAWENSGILAAFVMFAWVLVLLHVLVWRYFLYCATQLLKAAGHTTDQREMHARLVGIARDEAVLMTNEVASDALNSMERAQELYYQQHEAKRARRHWFLEFDTGLQLIATLLRNINTRVLRRGMPSERPSAPSGACPESLNVELTDGISMKQLCQRPPPIDIRWFSRKAWHMLIILLLMLNGFYLALLIQCGIYQLSLTQDDQSPAFMSALAAAMVAPLIINSLILQPQIFRHYVIVSNVFRIDARTLGEVVAHFTEIVALRSEFVIVVSRQLQRCSRSVDDLQRAFLAHDAGRSGEIELSKLRIELKALGLNISAYRFNSVVKLMFTIKGMRVQYAQILRVLAVGDCVDFPHTARRSLLGPIFQLGDDDNIDLLFAPVSLEQGQQADTEDHTRKPDMSASAHRVRPSMQQQQMSRRKLKRCESAFQTSSRTLQQLFHADSARELDTDPQCGQTPYMMM